MASYLINTTEKMHNAIKELCKHDRISCDTETHGDNNDISGLHPFHGARAFSIIFATKEDEYYFNFNGGGIPKEFKKELQPIFEDENRIIFFINAVFDATILHFDSINIKARIIDGPSIARVEFNKHGKRKFDKESFLSMDYLAEYYGQKPKMDEVKKFIVDHDLYNKELGNLVEGSKYIRCRFTGEKIPRYQDVPLILMVEYGCSDARTTFDTCTKIIKCINFKDKKYAESRGDKPFMIDVAKNEIALTSVLVDMKIKGMRHWDEYTLKAEAYEKEISLRLHAEIENLTGGINLNSGKQVADYLITKGVNVPRKAPTENAFKMAKAWEEKRRVLENQLDKINIKKVDATNKKIDQCTEKIYTYKQGNYITDKKTLKKLMKEYPNLDFLGKITTAKEADKKISTYYSNFLKLQDENDIIHCGLNQEKAKTGRFSSSVPNLQNLEKLYVPLNSDEYCVRKSFIADEGCRLFFLDYASQEMIFMLDQAGEMPIIEKLKSGEYKDFYLATAAILFESLGIKITRQEAKAMALGLAYGKGNELLARELGYIGANATKAEIEAGKQKASTFKAQFFRALPKLKKLTKKLENQVKWYGKIHNAFGRVSYFDSEESYKALNGFVQGSSADITKTAMNNVAKLNLEQYGSRMALVVHDEIVFNIKIGEEEKVLPLIKKAMIDAYPFKHIALDVDIEYSPINKHGVSSWGEKTEWVN